MLSQADQDCIIASVNRIREYEWTQVQTNFLYNNYGSFLFKVIDYDEMITLTRAKQHEKGLPDDFIQYTLNRWYNHLCSLIVHSFFESHPRVRTEQNKRSLYADFYIDGNAFDLKLTFMFKGWPRARVLGALANPTELIKKYYAGGGADRAHYDPKLFIVLFDLDDVSTHAWRMKRDFARLHQLVRAYLDGTSGSDHLKKFSIIKRRVEYPVKSADLMFLWKQGKQYTGTFYVWRNNLPKRVDIGIPTS